MKSQALWFVNPQLKSWFLSEKHKQKGFWIELDTLNDAFGLLVSTQNERLHCLTGCVTNTGLKFNIHTLQDNPTSDYFLHDCVSLFHFMFKHSLSFLALLIIQAWLYGLIQSETVSGVLLTVALLCLAIEFMCVCCSACDSSPSLYD